MTGAATTGRGGKKYNYYSCSTEKCSKRTSIPKESFENDFTKFLQLYTPDERLMAALEEALKIEYESVYAKNISKSQGNEKKIARLAEELSRLVQLRVNGEIDNKTFIEESEKRKAIINELEAEQRALENPDESAESAVQFGISVVKGFPSTWKNLEVGELRELREALFPKNLQYEYPEFKTAELSPIYMVKAASGDEVNRLVTPREFESRFLP